MTSMRMSFCVKAATDLNDADLAAITDSIEASMAAGMDAKSAELLAVDDQLAALSLERRELVTLIQQQFGERLKKPAARATVATTIEDAGEKIGGARKDRWAERGLDVSDLDGMSEAEGATLATKANVWKPDYAAIAAASDPVTAAMVKVIYDGLAAKPKTDTPQGRRDYVTAMQAVRKVYSAVRSVQEVRDAYQKLRAELGVYAKDFEAVQAGKRVMFAVYKGRSDPFTFDYNMGARAKKLVEQGFPGEVAPWTRRFAIRASYWGSGFTPEGIARYIAEAEQLGTPMTEAQLRTDFFEVRTLGDRPKTVGYAPTREAAEALAAERYEATKGKKDDKAEPERPHLDKVLREGLPQRIDRDVTAEDFLEAFGWRGIEFGNWAAQDERQRLLNLAFDSLHDLADVLGIPAKALSLSGRMGLAFGARGGGRFAAHYEPGRLVINMTKLRGAGSLAHEWAHALDHYLGELDRPDAYQGNARGASGWYSQARYTGKPQTRTVKDENGRWVSREVMRLDNLRPELAAKVDEVMRKLYEAPIPREQAIDMERAEVKRLESYLARELDAGLRKTYESMLAQRRELLAQLEAGAESTRTKRSSYAEQAQRLSGKATDGYWVRPTEMFARAFESFVFDRLREKGARSDYLVHGVEAERYADETRFKGNPYPAGPEREAINAAFDALARELKTRDEGDGKVALYSRGAGAGIRPAAVQAAVDRITESWGNKPEVVVLGSMADAPQPVREHDAKMRSQGAAGEPEGFFWQGRVYLNASQLSSIEDVQRVLFHEALGHFGLRGAFGKELEKVLRQVIGGRRAEVDAKRLSYGLPDTDAGRLVAAEEVLAELAQTKPELGLVQRAIAAIRSALRKVGVKLALTDAELVRDFLEPARAFVQRGGKPGGKGAPMFSRGGQRLERREVQRDFDGSPWFEGDRVDLVAPKEVMRPEVIADEGESILRFQIMGRGSAKSLGFVELLMRDGRPVSLLDIEVKPEGRKNGTGRDAVEAVLAATDGDLNISNIVTEARGFWASLGVPEQNQPDGYAYEGVLNAETYRRRPGRDAAGVRAAAGQAAREGAAGFGEPRGTGAAAPVAGEEPQASGQGDDLDAPLFSRTPAAELRREAAGDFMAGLRDRSTTSGFNALHKTLATQLHKASVSQDYARVFNIAQDYELDVARSASRPAEKAPTLLPSFDNLRSAWHRLVHGGEDEARVRKVGDAIWAGTLEGGPEPHTGKVWSDSELRERFGLDDQQVQQYREARKAIDASLDESAAALAFQLVKAYAPSGMRDAVRREPSRMRDLLGDMAEQIEASGPDAREALAKALEVLGRADQLKAGGYAPLMRFGRFAVSVTGEDGELLHFEKFETELQAKTAALKLRREYPRASVERSTMDTEGFKLFAGVDPESVALFAKQLEGQLDDDVLQAWYRNAVSERSAFKRMIGPRKGMPGYSQELRRVLASFITSNARLSARQFNMGDMAAAIADMRERRVPGDVVDEAVRLKEYLDNPVEPFAALKGLMFTWYLGGSVAAAAVNATQPLMMTLPYLSQFGSASKHLASSVKEAMSGKITDKELSEALARAADDGKVDPQQVHHLYHEGMSGLIDKLPAGQSLKDRAQGAMTLWGAMFGAVENFNRRLTFIAAYRMAKADPELGDAYAFAIKAIDDTQGIYNKSNRPNWARGTGAFGAIGAAAFTFKQYSIAYVELLVRMAKSGPKGKRAALAMLGVLFLAAGVQGLPGADDLEDLADTVAQRLGYRGNVRAAMRETLHDALGAELGDLVMYGAGGALPVDLQSRIGLGNLVPATGLLMPSNRDNKARQLAELVGPAGGLASQVGDFLDAKGTSSAMGAFAPLAIKNALMGLEMADTGEYRDTRGRLVTETDGMDALAKGIGFQPQRVSDLRRPEGMVRQDIARVRQVEADIVALRAQAMAEGDPALRREADEKLREWNTRNPELRITIKDSQVLRRVKEMRRTSGERLLSTAPRETRRAMAESME